MVIIPSRKGTRYLSSNLAKYYSCPDPKERGVGATTAWRVEWSGTPKRLTAAAQCGKDRQQRRAIAWRVDEWRACLTIRHPVLALLKHRSRYW
jgi:hypothetical protein